MNTLHFWLLFICSALPIVILVILGEYWLYQIRQRNRMVNMNDVKYKGKNLNDLSRVELIEALEQAAKMIQYLHERI